MNYFRSLTLLARAGAVLATALAATSAVAAPITTVVDYARHGNGTTNDAGTNFAFNYAANTPTGAVWSDDIEVPAGTGTLPGQYQSPFHNNVLTATTSYFAVNATAAVGSSAPAGPSPASLTWLVDKRSFSILWGSIDTFNTITFKDDGGTANGGTEYSYTGTDIANLIMSQHSTSLSAVNNSYHVVALVTFQFTGSEKFDEIEFKSELGGQDRNAFEFALAPVPGPATGLLFLTALGCLGFARRARATA